MEQNGIEQRRIERREYKTNCLMIEKYSLARINGVTKDVSPLGVAILVSGKVQKLLGCDVIIMSNTFIMMASVVREVDNGNGTRLLGLKAKEVDCATLNRIFKAAKENNNTEKEKEEE